MLQIKFEIGSSTIKRAFNYDWKGMGVRSKGAKRLFPPLFSNWDKEPKFCSNPEVRSSIPIKLIYFLRWQFICQYDTHSAQKPGSLSWCCAVMSLQFTHIRCFACLQRLEVGSLRSSPD